MIDALLDTAIKTRPGVAAVEAAVALVLVALMLVVVQWIFEIYIIFVSHRSGTPFKAGVIQGNPVRRIVWHVSGCQSRL